MKKLIIPLVCFVIISYSSLFASPFHGGDGTTGNPFQIYNETELLVLINANDATTWSDHYILTNNITCSSSYTNTIGNGSIHFMGSFNGQGHSINNLTINRPTGDYIGLFGYTESATITNLNLVNVNITGSDLTGGLVGYNYSSTISNCYASGNVSGSQYIGGLIGWNYQSIISNCYASGNVSGDFTGGLVGENYQSTISNCYASSNISGDYTGSLVGYNISSTISNCYASGNVSGSLHTGGLVGYNQQSTISNCYASGNVSGSNNIGGLVGGNYSSTISNCYASGSVSGSHNTGGLVGENFQSTISNCYASGSISGSLHTGGLVGFNYNSSFTCCYWDTQTSGLNYGVDGGNVSGLTGLTDLEMRDASNFPCFNKTTIWAFDGLNYPQLRTFFADKVPALSEWSRYGLIFSVLLFGCYFVYKKLYV